MPINERPQLVMGASARGEAIVYKCSARGQMFLLPNEQTPKDAAAKLWAAWNQHVQEKHSDEGAG